MSNQPPNKPNANASNDADNDDRKTEELEVINESGKGEDKEEPRRKEITLTSAFRRLDPDNRISDARVEIALDSAWRRFNAYDKQASDLKHRYMEFRLFIIGASFLTTVLAVIETYTENSDFWSLVLTIALVALPGISAAVLTFAARFESGNAWVGFRGAAETIKRSIYELRVKRAVSIVTQDDLNKLRDIVKRTAQQLDDMGVNTPLFVDSIDEKNPDSKALAKPNYVDMPGKDDGYAPIELEDYMKWRIFPQAEWYRKRAVSDYNKTRIYRASILLLSVAGPVIAAVGLGRWVAVSVAMVSVLSALLSLRQYEQNYGVYNRTARKLEDLVNDYRVNSELMKPAEKLLWLTQIENVISGEREVWQLSVLSGQAATEEALNQLVSDRTSVLQDERRAAIGQEPHPDENDDETKKPLG